MKISTSSIIGLLALVVVLPYMAFVKFHLSANTFTQLQTQPASIILTNIEENMLKAIEEAREAVESSHMLENTYNFITEEEVAVEEKEGSSVEYQEAHPSNDFNTQIHQQAEDVPPLSMVGAATSPATHESITTMREDDGHSNAFVPRKGKNGELKDLVIGLGTGITPENLAVFAGSLRLVNPESELVLYLDAPLPKLHTTIVKKYNISSIEFSVDLLQPSFLQKYHPSNYRWPLLHRFIEEHHDLYGKVLLADVRDTMFQEDPFSFFDTGFYAFNGVESRTIGECGWNGGWVKDCFGKVMLDRLSKKTIICSGVSMGSTDDVLDYLSKMQATMETEAFAKCERNGVDQGVHNVLVHTNKLNHLTIKDQKSGWVANMQSGRAKINHNKVYNAEGKKVAVVHQYDRFRDLQANYFKRFVFWEMPSEAETCAEFKVEHGVELFKKTCDLKVTNGHSASHCCVACQRMKGCQAFSFAGSQCFLKSCNKSTRSIQADGVTSGYMINPPVS